MAWEPLKLDWPPEWETMTAEERGNDLLMRCLRHPPMKQKEFIGRSVAIRRVPRPKVGNPKPRGFYNTIPGDSLLSKINAAIPRGLRQEWRDDLVQDIALAILSGEVDEGILEDMRQIGRIRNKVIARYPERWAYMTVADEETSEDELREMLRDGESHDLAEVQRLWLKR